MNRKIIPIFYACDNSFVKYTAVSLSSMIKNASDNYYYRIYILHNDISESGKAELLRLENSRFSITFINMNRRLEDIEKKLPIRDYYSKTTYYRIFIPEIFEGYDKVIYIDSDTVVTGDISELYETELGDSYVAACHEQVMIQVDEFGTYAEKTVGISRYEFFNAGVLLINCRKFREKSILKKFISLLNEYDFRVTQDEDYLNVLCKDRVLWLDQRWNTEVFGDIGYPIEEAKILHYIMTSKPWHYPTCSHADIFWRYAEDTSVYAEIQNELAAYTDAERENDIRICENLKVLALEEIDREDNYIKRVNSSQRSPDRVAVLNKISSYEKNGTFDVDAEDDPPSRTLMPDEINYLENGIFKRIKTAFAFAAARLFVRRLVSKKELIVKEIRGIEYFKNLQSGAVITCNHFNAYDSFAMQMAYDASGHKKRKFYRVVREGNYTSFPGFYGLLMRNCNTLPLSSNRKTLKKFIEATDELLKRGNFVLVYPEQSMWWNYRKPKPLKAGAFSFAVKSGVPVLPCFITMKDTDILGKDGFPVQEYTVNIGAPIYPDIKLDERERVNKLMADNADVWNRIYTEAYGHAPVYETKK